MIYITNLGAAGGGGIPAQDKANREDQARQELERKIRLEQAKRKAIEDQAVQERIKQAQEKLQAKYATRVPTVQEQLEQRLREKNLPYTPSQHPPETQRLQVPTSPVRTILSQNTPRPTITEPASAPATRTMITVTPPPPPRTVQALRTPVYTPPPPRPSIPVITRGQAQQIPIPKSFNPDDFRYQTKMLAERDRLNKMDPRDDVGWIIYKGVFTTVPRTDFEAIMAQERDYRQRLSEQNQEIERQRNIYAYRPVERYKTQDVWMSRGK